MSFAGSDDGLAGPIRAVLEDPEAGRERLPGLLSLFDADERAIRLAAGWAVTLVVEARPDVAEPVARRLADRLAGEGSLEARHAFAYLRERFPEAVDEALLSAAEDADRGERRRYLELSRGFVRSDYLEVGPGDREVGRTRIAGRAAPAGGRRHVESRSVGGVPANADESADADPADGDATGDGIDGEEDPERGTEAGRAAAGSHRARAAKLESAAAAVGLEDVIGASRFDDLAVVAEPVEGRYTDVYRTRAIRDDTEVGIALRVFRGPDGEDFAADVTAALENWGAVADHEFVVSLYDWADDPDPWMATEYASTTLYDRIDVGLSEAVWNALKIAEAIGYAHERGVLHTGLDPYSVVYTDAVVDDRQQPLVANFGLLDAVREHADPSALLDPRFAAPEYFDRSFGDVDHATDVYQLGAVIYRLVTGRPPFRGDYGTVRDAVTGSRPLPPSEINPAIPDWLDAVVRKAMAKQKLTRYESVTQLASELRGELEG